MPRIPFILAALAAATFLVAAADAQPTLCGARPLSEGKAGYDYSKRQAMYPFLVKHLGLDAKGILDPKDPKTGSFDESKTIMESVSQMQVFNDQRPQPGHALKPGAMVAIR